MAAASRSSSSARASSAPPSPGIWPKAGAAVTIVDAGAARRRRDRQFICLDQCELGQPGTLFPAAHARRSPSGPGLRRRCHGDPARLERRACAGTCRRKASKPSPPSTRPGATASAASIAPRPPASSPIWPTSPDFALHVAGEGAVEPAPAAQVLVADAVRRGAKLMTGTRVEALVRDNGRVVGVRDGRRRPCAPTRWCLPPALHAPDLAATVGVGLPIDTPPGLLVHSRPHGERLLNGLVLGERLHMRQTAEGRIVAGSDFGGADPGADAADTARALFAEVQAMLVGGDRLELDFHTLGYRPTPADGFPIIGRADRHRRPLRRRHAFRHHARAGGWAVRGAGNSRRPRAIRCCSHTACRASP